MMIERYGPNGINHPDWEPTVLRPSWFKRQELLRKDLCVDAPASSDHLEARSEDIAEMAANRKP